MEGQISVKSRNLFTELHVNRNTMNMSENKVIKKLDLKE